MPAMGVGQASLGSRELENYRRELTGYCYRMLGSGFGAEDAVQETLVRAWRKADTFEGRSSLRSWLYRIATNVCIDMSRQVQRRARPMEMGPSSAAVESNLGQPVFDTAWIGPLPDAGLRPENDDPAAVAEYRESVRLAFVAALQHLPARQRAAVVLCDVLRWRSSEVAELLETTVAAVNSSLQRARDTLGSLQEGVRPARLDPPDDGLLDRYVAAFERYDIDELVSLLHADAVQSMPPFAMWLQGAEEIGRFMLLPEPSKCRGSRLIPVEANGSPAFAQYKPDPAGGLQPWGIQLLEISHGRIAELAIFLAPMAPERLFPAFGLPLHLDS